MTPKLLGNQAGSLCKFWSYYLFRTVLIVLAISSTHIASRGQDANISVQALQPGGGVDVIAAQNALLGYDHRRQFQKKLLEFVSPVHKTSLISTQLIESLSKTDSNSSLQKKASADQLASIGASAMQLEQQARITEQSIRLQMLQQQGIQSGGGRSTVRAGGLVAKSAELRALANLHQEKVHELEERFKAQRETRKLKLANRLQNIKSLDIKATNVISGLPQNVLLRSLQELLLKYGQAIATDPNYKEQIEALEILSDDLAQIRLKQDAEGEPVIFNLKDGPSSLGKLPFPMQHPQILPIARKLEARLAESETTSQDFYTTIRELSLLHAQLEQVSNEVLGTRQESARKGTHEYRLWCMAKRYRDGIKGRLNRLELDGQSNNGLYWNGKFDPEVQGRNTLTFVEYVVNNGCQFAPGEPSGGPAYVRLQRNLLRLDAILNIEE